MLRKTLATLVGACLALLTSFAVSSPALASPVQDEDGPIAHQVELEPPFFLVSGALDFRFEVDSQVLAFRATAEPLVGYPGSLWIANSPLGAGALLEIPGSPVGSYLLGFQASDVFPIVWNSNVGGSAGVAGHVAAVVTQAPIAEWQDPVGPPPPPTVGIRPAKNGGNDGVIISVTGDENCFFGFVQFVSVKVTWKGHKKSDGTPTSGTGAGPQSSKANGGNPMATDGSTTYVDAPTAGDSEYPNQGAAGGPGAGQVTQSMGDSPGLKDPEPLVDDIEAANPDVEVTEITFEQRFTTYVWMDCGAGRQIIAKVEWSRTQTVTIDPDNTGPAGGPGGFGGPAAGPPPAGSPFTNGQPTITPVGGMDPEHSAAEQSHNAGTCTGAGVQGW